MKYLNHVEIMKEFIGDILSKGKNTFTHKDIINATNTNCPYSILRYLKKYYEIDFEDITEKRRKHDLEGNIKYVNIKFRRYKVIKRKDENVQKPNIRGEGKISNNETIQLGKSLS